MKLKYSVFCITSILICSIYLSFSQSVDIQRIGNKTFIIEKQNSSQFRIIPAYGSESLLPSTNIFEENTNVDNINSLNWVLKYTGPGSYDFRDISFANSQTGYICSEYGGVFKTTNRGDNWASVIALGFPYYFYGIYALSPDTVVTAGFNDVDSIRRGVVKWSFNGGTTWGNNIVLQIPNAAVGWLTKIHFFNQNTGIVSNEFSGGIYYTTNGGKDVASWHYVLVNSDMGWFAGDVDFDANGTIFTTGIHFAHSTNFGLNWTSGPSADNVFDGGVDFIDNNLMKGITGGGSISPTVAGWIHRTTDGGITWSSRILNSPWPIRSVKYFADTLMLAFGGDVYDTANISGGIYSSTNAGANWNLDLGTNSEMLSYDYHQVTIDSTDIWAVGMVRGSYAGVDYKATMGNVVGVNSHQTLIPSSFNLFQNYPNPFNPTTNIKYQIANNSFVTLKVFDILGREVETLVSEKQNAGNYDVTFDRGNLPSGVYFYKLTAGNYSETRKMIMIK